MRSMMAFVAIVACVFVLGCGSGDNPIAAEGKVELLDHPEMIGKPLPIERLTVGGTKIGDPFVNADGTTPTEMTTVEVKPKGVAFRVANGKARELVVRDRAFLDKLDLLQEHEIERRFGKAEKISEVGVPEVPDLHLRTYEYPNLHVVFVWDVVKKQLMHITVFK